MRMIDADEYKEKLYEMMPEFDEEDDKKCIEGQTIFFCIATLNDIPTIVPAPNDPLTLEGGCSHEIVHCKDCVNLYFKDFSAFCPHRVSACRPEGFCEYGERRRPEIDS